MDALLAALSLQAGYNAALVAIGAGLFGLAAGATGTFLFLRKRALVSDAIAHATLPGIAIAFMVMVALGGDGRHLVGLLLGSAASAVAGLVLVEWIARRTRLAEDAAIGAVLSVFFGMGVVCLTIIQAQSEGRQAGLEGFLLGSTAGMLYADALTIAIGAVLTITAVAALRRPLTMVAFDPQYAAAQGISVRAADLAIMGLVTAVIVVGLKLVGLILVVALLIIPPVAARFWTERARDVLWIAAAVGAVSGYVGAAISASAPALPTGAIVVLVAFAIFAFSMLFAPSRGVLAAALARRAFNVRVHRRQGLLALANGEPIYDAMTLAVLRREGFIRRDGVVTREGRSTAAAARRDEARWIAARELFDADVLAGRSEALEPIEAVFTADEVAAIDARLKAFHAL